MEKDGRAWSVVNGAVLTGLAAVALWMQRQPLADIVAIGARDAEQSHIFLVPVVALWLAYLRRSRLRTIRWNPSMWGPLIILASGVMSWWGFENGVQIAWHAGAMGTVLGVIVSCLGLEPIRQFAPVVAVFMFALPVPGIVRQAIALPLQDLATSVTHGCLEMVGVGATRLGNILVINGERIAVGEACNGMRMVFAFFLIVYAFAYGLPLRSSTRLLLLAASPIAALVCNVLRLVPTSLIYGYGTATHAEWFHDASGWIMLPVALFGLVVTLRFLRWLEIPVLKFRLATQ